MFKSQLIRNSLSSMNHSRNQQTQQKCRIYACICFISSFFLILIATISKAHETYGTQIQSLQLKRLSEMFTTTKINIEMPSQSNLQWFGLPISDLIINSDLDSLYRRDRTVYSMDRQIQLRAILLTQLIHSINVKGQIEIQLSPFEDSIEQKRRALQKVMQYERKYYEKKYEIQKYQKEELPFCIVIPSYNNIQSGLYKRNLDSLFMQDYKNYHIVYIDDKSPQNTGIKVRQYAKQKEFPEQKINIIVNTVNKKALRNIYEGIHNYCNNGQIVGLIDGDDSLIGRLVLKLFNAIYQKTSAALVYSNFLKIQLNQRTAFGFGSTLTQQYLQQGKLRNEFPVLATHFMTFYTDLFKKVNKSDFCYQNGTFYDYAYDAAIITPLMELAFPRIYYLKQMTYQYRNDTGTNDGTRDWFRVAQLVKAQKPYDRLTDFIFIDQNPVIKNAYHPQDKIKSNN